MTQANPITAEILEASAAGYASAASALLERTVDAALPDGWGSAEWKAHLTQRILELATAIRVDNPGLFARRVNWLRRAVRARGASEADLRTALESIKEALDQELPDALKESVEQPFEMALAVFDSDIEPEASALDVTTPHGKLALEYLATCLEARSEAATELILDALNQDMKPAEIYAEVLLPAQREIGQLWHVGDVSITEERLVTETTRTVMSLIVHQYAPEAESGKTVLAASVAGNAHDIGLRALAHLFRLAGWRTIFLGANTPSIEIARAAQAFNADLVLLNATLTTQLGTLGAVIEKIKQVASSSRILVGGLALEDSPDLWKSFGADGYAPDVQSAITIGAKLIANH
jgi:methanogenic corrinoid protein MtbC1